METTREIFLVSSQSVAADRLRGRLSSASAWGEGLGLESGAAPQNEIL